MPPGKPFEKLASKSPRTRSGVSSRWQSVNSCLSQLLIRRKNEISLPT